jgi:hypothetical protein
MPIKQNTPESEIDEYIKVQLERMNNALIYQMKYIAEECLNAARNTNSYKDQTGNLRSSLGYVLAVDGQLLEQGEFEVVKQGKAGAKSGITYAKQLIQEFPEGIALIMVAGMHYAAFVSAKGYDVLDSSQLRAEKLVPKILKQLGFTQ